MVFYHAMMKDLSVFSEDYTPYNRKGLMTMEKQTIIHYALQYFCNLKKDGIKYYLINNITHIVLALVIETIEYKLVMWDNGNMQVFSNGMEI